MRFSWRILALGTLATSIGCSLIVDLDSLSPEHFNDDASPGADATSDLGPTLDAPSAVDASDAAEDSGPRSLIPDEGTYYYTNTADSGATALGQDTLNVNNGGIQGTHDLSTVKGEVVRTANNCFVFTLTLTVDHTEARTLCLVGNTVNYVSQVQKQSWYGNFDTTNITCSAGVLFNPGATVGAPTNSPCSGMSQGAGISFDNPGIVTLVGTENVTVAGTAIPALHFSEYRTISGTTSGITSTGSDKIDWWFDPTTALVLRSHRESTFNSAKQAPCIGVCTVVSTTRWDFVLVTRAPVPLPSTDAGSDAALDAKKD